MKLFTRIYVSLVALLLTSVFLSQSNAWAQRVDREELEKNSKPVEFENYRGPHRQVDSRVEIIGIGSALARGKGDRGSYQGKYTILHRIDKTSDKLSADIFILERGARVDHIRNIRRIISGYLEAEYGYSYKDAHTLSIFISYYNAIYRNDINYVQEMYAPVVISSLDKNKIGLAINYRDWPGKTQMLIPVADGKPDTTSISDDEVIEELRREKDKGIPEREELVKIKEEELKKDKEKTEQKKEEIKKDKEEINQEREDIEKKKEELDKKEEEIKNITDEEERQKEEEKLEQEKEEVKKQEEELDKKEDQVTDKENQVQEAEKQQAQKEEEIKSDKESIEDDKTEKSPEQVREELKEKEKELEEKKDELQQSNVFEGKIYYLRKVEYSVGGHYSNEMYILDPGKKVALIKSPYSYISGRKYSVFGGGVIVIGRSSKQGFENRVHHLVSLNLDTLAEEKMSEENIFWRSFVETREDFIYAILEDNGKYYAAKFDTDLKLVARSEVQVDPDTFVTFFGDSIFLNNAKGGVIILNQADLKLSAPVDMDN